MIYVYPMTVYWDTEGSKFQQYLTLTLDFRRKINRTIFVRNAMEINFVHNWKFASFPIPSWCPTHQGYTTLVSSINETSSGPNRVPLTQSGHGIFRESSGEVVDVGQVIFHVHAVRFHGAQVRFNWNKTTIIRAFICTLKRRIINCYQIILIQKIVVRGVLMSHLLKLNKF